MGNASMSLKNTDNSMLHQHNTSLGAEAGNQSGYHDYPNSFERQNRLMNDSMKFKDSIAGEGDTYDIAIETCIVTGSLRSTDVFDPRIDIES